MSSSGCLLQAVLSPVNSYYR